MKGIRLGFVIPGLVAVVSAVFSAAVWAQCETAKLHSPDGAVDTRFGWATAISGDYMVVGAPDAHVGSHADAGRAFVFKHDGLDWVQVQELPLPSTEVLPGAEYGYSAAIDGDVAVVGARYHGSYAEGAAFVWRRSPANAEWEYEGILWPADRAAYDNCGYSVAVDTSSEEWIALGCPGRTDVALAAGVVATFKYDGSSGEWAEQGILTANDGSEGDKLGRAIAMDGDWLVAGAEGTDDSAGAAFLFKYDGAGTWTNVRKLVALNEDGSSDAHDYDRFGGSVALRGDRTACGAYYYDADDVPNTGVAYVYVYSGDTWEIEGRLLASDRAKSDALGTSVAIDGDRVVVGAPKADPDALSGAGAAYLFRLREGSWTQDEKMIADAPAASQYFGDAVSLDGDHLAIGAYKENSDTGAAFVFALGLGEDCNNSAIHDECEYYQGILTDDDGDGYPDQCICDNDESCNDDRDCTTDTCNLETNRCEFTVAAGSCLIEGTCYSDGQVNPNSECQVCDSAHADAWTNAADETYCTADDNDCTDDICLSGWCVHPHLESGAPCGDQSQSDCDLPDFCFEGICRENRLTNGTPCTPDDSVCTFDWCDGGICTHPEKPSGSPCTPDEFDCTFDECQDGVCEHSLKPAGSPCGDPTDDICTDPDTCLADGVCQANHAPVDTPCPNGLFCDGDELCDGEGVCLAGLDPCADSGWVCDEGNDVCMGGACCLPMGDCVEVIAEDCSADGGIYQGDGVRCSTVECPVPPGACCVRDVCVPDQDEDDCLSVAGAAWAGPATVCVEGLCPLCDDGDADADGDVDLLDFAYLQTCLEEDGVGDCKCVDLDNVGGVDLADFGYFTMVITGP